MLKGRCTSNDELRFNLWQEDHYAALCLISLSCLEKPTLVPRCLGTGSSLLIGEENKLPISQGERAKAFLATPSSDLQP